MTKPWLPPSLSRPAANSPPLGPMLAGARARGVADGLEWLGLAAILIDDRGEALHVNASAIELMGEALYLDGGRLRAVDVLADTALNDAIHAVLEEDAAAARVPLREGELHVHVAAMRAQGDDPYQLLRAVVLLRRLGPDQAARR